MDNWVSYSYAALEGMEELLLEGAVPDQREAEAGQS